MLRDWQSNLGERSGSASPAIFWSFRELLWNGHKFCQRGRSSMQLFWRWELKPPSEAWWENSKVGGRGVCVYWPMLELPVIPLELHSLWTLTESSFVIHLHWGVHPLTLLSLELAVYFGASHVCLYWLSYLFQLSNVGPCQKAYCQSDKGSLIMLPLKAQEINQTIDKPWVTYQRWEEALPWLDFYLHGFYLNQDDWNLCSAMVELTFCSLF